ncbi:MAG: hypothetical protein HY607_03020 [Planctomycetes bacterium]|nr:hypothetical protein [Planctomycetota bacterium]MBI4221640.1 hypothetical protein [Planctomycetota bacterium]
MVRKKLLRYAKPTIFPKGIPSHQSKENISTGIYCIVGKNGINSYAVDNAVVVDNIAVSEIPGFPEGLFFVQDISAMKVAQFLKVKKSNAVLDMCSARR